MTLQIKNEELEGLNSTAKINSFFSCANDISKRRALAILHLKENTPGVYDADLLECAIPNVKFIGFKIPKNNPEAEAEIFLQLNFKTIQMLKDGSTFIIKADTLTIKNGTTVIKDAYQYTEDEVKTMYDSYMDVSFDESSVTDEVSLTAERDIFLLISAILSKPEAFINVQNNKAIVVVDGSFVYYTKEKTLPADLYINCYLANRINAILNMTGGGNVIIKKGDQFIIEGYVEGEKVIENCSVVYEMPMDPLQEEDLKNISPTDQAYEINISSAELVAGLTEAKKSIGNFIANPFNFAFMQNGSGMSVKFKDDLSDSSAIVHIGEVLDGPEDGLSFPDYKVYLPFTDLGLYTKGNVPISIKYDPDNSDTSVLISLEDGSYILTGKI